ncbi:MAG: hypothetical protein KBT50_05075 [Cycloclasticus sp.]|nr:hypothetical protein [Cycloclasticus sp.]MBQ0789974.1 hypothetical protein [Cycloclasticus sp.]
MDEKKTSVMQYEHVVRVCIESSTPLSIQGGDIINTEDANILTDSNGLPMIPGKTLRGTLRALYKQAYENPENDCTNKLWGYQDTAKGQASNISIDFAVVHDSKNSPATGLLSQQDITNDTLLSYLQSLQTTPLLRERNAINARGAVKDGVYYNFAIAPKGLRYTFEISYETNEETCPTELTRILSLIKSPLFRLGSYHHKNLGAFNIISLKHYLIDNTNQESIDGYPCTISNDANFKDITDTVEINHSLSKKESTYTLNAVDFWRIGAGTESFSGIEKQPDMLPLSEPVIEWEEGNFAKIKTMIILPGTAILGPLAHRLDFHYRCEKGEFVSEDNISSDKLFKEQRTDATNALFGKKTDHENSKGHAGIISINDIYLDPKTWCAKDKIGQQIHNKISHHLGGTIDSALFSEELLYQTEVTIAILELKEIPVDYSDAWKTTLDDFLNNRLAIGAASGRGHGYFQASTEVPA